VAVQFEGSTRGLADTQLSSNNNPAAHKRLPMAQREDSRSNDPCIVVVNHVPAVSVGRGPVGRVKATIAIVNTSAARAHQPDLPINGSD